MAAGPSTLRYRKLPGRSTSLLGYTTLHLGPDHLLQAQTVGWSESYKRFYFRDIQALLVVRTGYWSGPHVAAGLCALACLGLSLSFFATADPDLRLAGLVLGGLGAVCVAALIVSLLAGPGCRCVIRTAVQTERLPSLNRYRRALRVLAQLRPLIEEAQAGLAPRPPGPAPELAAADAAPGIGQPAPAAPGSAEAGAPSFPA